MKYLKYFFIVLFLFLFIPCLSFAFLGSAETRIIVKVTTETGEPLDGAQISIGMKEGHLKKEAIHGVTDSNGVFEISGTSVSDVSIGVDKQKFYHSSQHHDFFYKKFGRWLPWPKEISVFMRPIVNPVPMYVRHRSFEIPLIGEEVGFDLEKSDWVIPHGQGTQADFIFKIDRRVASYDDFDASMVLTFSNKLDGIQVFKDDGGGIFNTGSQFRLPRIAPLDGYQNTLKKTRSTSSPGFYSHSGEDINYLFRVRSEVDENGNLVKAMYGKIKGKIEFEPRRSKTAKIYLYYYLNPDYTRNLEFDPKRNLSIVSGDERVEQP